MFNTTASTSPIPPPVPASSLFEPPANSVPTVLSQAPTTTTSRLIFPPTTYGTSSPASPVASTTVIVKKEPIASSENASAEKESALRKQVEELSQKTKYLEEELTKKEEQIRVLSLPKPMPDAFSNDSTSDLPLPISAATTPPVAEQTSKPIPPQLPVLKIQGVTVKPDAGQVRIGIVDTVLFRPGTWQLSTEGEDAMRQIIAEVRAKSPGAMLNVEGHTDSLVTDPTNPTQKHDLAAHKASVVMDYLVQALRWDATRIKKTSLGPAEPVAENGTPDGRASNNRIEIVVQ